MEVYREFTQSVPAVVRIVVADVTTVSSQISTDSPISIPKDTKKTVSTSEFNSNRPFIVHNI